MGERDLIFSDEYVWLSMAMLKDLFTVSTFTFLSSDESSKFSESLFGGKMLVMIDW